ncbi:hypothetical protein HY498_05720 [Candidatus Woesearchaeota archaeon]|nr:hypothetical protein [Candidatus Woesearchaeota archaeon]
MIEIIQETIDKDLEENVTELETDLLEDPKYNVDYGKVLANLFAGRYKSKKAWEEFEKNGTNINLEGKVIQAHANKEENLYINDKLFHTDKIKRVKFEDNTSYDTYEKVLTKAVDLLSDKDFNASKEWLEIAKKTLESQKVIWQKGVYTNGKSVRNNRLVVKFSNKIGLVTVLQNENVFNYVLDLVDKKIESKVKPEQLIPDLPAYQNKNKPIPEPVLIPIKEETKTYRNGNNPLEKIISDNGLNFWEKLYRINNTLLKDEATEKQASEVNGLFRDLVTNYKLGTRNPWTDVEIKRIQTVQNLLSRYIFYKRSGFLGGFKKHLNQGNRTQREYVVVEGQTFDVESLNELGYDIALAQQNNNGHKPIRFVERAKCLFGRITNYFSARKAA